MVRVSISIYGQVQGVAFRYHTCRQAVALGVTGWIRNLPDGSVEGLFEGDDIAVATLVEWCHSGPPSAQVENLDIHTRAYRGEFDTFQITN